MFICLFCNFIFQKSYDMKSKNGYKKILKALGPCGLNCEKCFANASGGIKYHSKKLKELLGNFDIYAERFITLLDEPKFRHYPVFKLMLDYFANVNCQGCRAESCMLFQNCGVKDCYKVKGVDFCFQCNEFPCVKTNFDDHLKQRWIKINQRMLEAGVETYYKEIKDKPRY
jgi:hypothetical protein